MLVIHKREIHIPKGETDSFNIEYTSDPPVDGTILVFSVKKTEEDPEPVIEKSLIVMDGKATVELLGDETDLEPGEYKWDLMEESGYRPVPPSLFMIEKVVGNRVVI